MTSAQKTALSLLTTVILFGAFTVLAFAGLFSVIDARFYQPAKISEIQKNLDKISSVSDFYIEALGERFGTGESAFLKNRSVMTYAEARPDNDSVAEREQLSGDLRAETQGLLGMRLVDSNGQSIYYSTFRIDILRQVASSNLTAYRNYSDAVTASGHAEIEIAKLQTKEGDSQDKLKVFFDGRDSRLIFSFPFYDRYGAFRGTMLFYVSAQDFNRILLKENLITIGNSGKLLTSNSQELFEEKGTEELSDNLSGFVFGIPSVGQEEFEKQILGKWNQHSVEVQKILTGNYSGAEEHFWVMLSSLSENGVYISSIYNDELFVMPQNVRILILICIFITLFLFVFMLFNLRQDDMTVIRARIRNLQLGVVDEYLKHKEEFNWEKISGRREEVTKEIIASLGRRAKKHPKEVEELINRSWDELLTAMNLRPQTGILQNGAGLGNTEEIREMLQEILNSGNIKVQAVGVAPQVQTPQTVPVKAAPVEDLEEVEEIEEAEAVEDLEEVEEIEEVESVEDLEEVEEIEEAEAVEDLEEVEEIEEAEAVEDLEEVEEIEEAEAVENLEEVEEIEEAESVEAEPVEETSAPQAEAVNFETEEISLDDFMGDGGFSPSGEYIEEPKKKSLLARAIEKKEAEHEERYEFDNGSKPLSMDDVSDDSGMDIFAMDFDALNNVSDDVREHGTLGINEKSEAEKQEDVLGDFSISKPGQEFEEVLDFDSDNALDNLAREALLSKEIPVEDEILFEVSAPPKLNLAFGDGKVSAAGDMEDVTYEIGTVPLTEKQKDARPFSFTSFGANNNGITELSEPEANAIAQDEDGVFYITDDVETNGVLQDTDFKHLVDSVLHV